MADKAASEAMLKTSSLERTIVDPTILTNGAKGSGIRELSRTERVGLRHRITRADVAAWILDETVANRHIKEEVLISK